jgi:hypothetical protein
MKLSGGHERMKAANRLESAESLANFDRVCIFGLVGIFYFIFLPAQE